MAILNYNSIPLSLTPIQLIAISGLLFGLLYLVFVQRPGFPSKAPITVSGDLPVVGHVGFWTQRFDFWTTAQKQSKTGNFSFHIGKHRVIGTQSDEGRKAFFESKDLSFSKGYAVLFGQSPSFDEEARTQGDKETVHSDYFKRRIAALLTSKKFQKALPTLISDLKTRLLGFASSTSADGTGITDPFDSIWKIVYLLTMRTVGCDEIANSPSLQDTTLKLFSQIADTSTATTTIFPWLPQPAFVKRYIGGGRMYMIFDRIVKARKQMPEAQRPDDPLQFLLDQGDNTTRVIQFVVGALFAGQINSGINASWMLVYLATNAHWLAEVRREVAAVADKYSPESTAPLLEKLGRLPLEAWEGEFPVVDMCLRETIRLQLHGTAFRKNVSGRDIVIGKEVIPPDAFVLYHVAAHHLNPSVYTSPYIWDPSRFLPDRAEDKKAPNAFIGWGIGRHPCLGMRFAKLENSMITAFFVAMFDFELLDKDEKPLEQPPAVNYNNWNSNKPDEMLLLRYRVREGVI